MSTLEKYLLALVGLAALATAIAPGKQTANIIGAGQKFVSGTLATASGQTVKA
ncbi:MAG TPA: hypothetical protein VFK47_01780 [Ktedonobacteraceae bacterium]|nr:hypothetical protein [Ktedonobacteraceae bacterium]